MGSKWMIDAKGYKSDAGEESMRELLASDDVHAGLRQFIAAHGALANAVQLKIEEAGFHISDRGGGCGAWHLGVPFDSLDEAFDYLQMMTTTFAPAIASSLLVFELKTWSRDSWK